MAALRRLALPLIGAILALLLWNTFIVYPIKIFVVLLHEMSHGLAAVLTGGSIERIEISFDEGGACVTRGGARFFILSAGYLGSLVWGALLLVAGARSRRDREIVGAIGAVTLFVTLFYVRSGFGFFYGILASAFLLVAAWKLPARFSDGFLKVVGAVSCLYAVWDIGSDVLLRDVAGSDARALSELTSVPAIVWGLVWVGLALAVTIFALSLAARSER